MNMRKAKYALNLAIVAKDTKKSTCVPGAGVEPACLAAGDFKSPVSTISPPGQLMKLG